MSWGYEHLGPGGHWEPYSEDVAMLIDIARSISPAEGSVLIPGGPFEVRWGLKAVSKSMTTVPHTEMLQVNIQTDKSRMVKATGSSQSNGLLVDDEDDVVFAHLSPNGIPVEYSEAMSVLARSFPRASRAEPSSTTC